MKRIQAILILVGILALSGFCMWVGIQNYELSERIRSLEVTLAPFLANLNSNQVAQINSNTPPRNRNQGTTGQGAGAIGFGDDSGAIQQPTSGISELRNHSMCVTTSTNPEQFIAATTASLEHASVPGAIRLTTTTTAGEAGDVLAYFVDSSGELTAGGENIALSKSTDDGATWSERQTITLTNKQHQGPAVDPSLIQLDNGQLRMYFFGPDAPASDPQARDGDHNVYSALSDDGIHFTVENGIRFSAPKLTDPTVIRLGSTWIMYASVGTTSVIATSTDGLTFTDTGKTWDGGGVPGAYVDSDDVVHVYGCAEGGIVTQTSTDGIHFSGEVTTTGLQACDPSPVLLDDDSVLMVYKKIETE